LENLHQTIEGMEAYSHGKLLPPQQAAKGVGWVGVGCRQQVYIEQ
jgi:hypothetical protein